MDLHTHICTYGYRVCIVYGNIILNEIILCTNRLCILDIPPPLLLLLLLTGINLHTIRRRISFLWCMYVYIIHTYTIHTYMFYLISYFIPVRVFLQSRIDVCGVRALTSQLNTRIRKKSLDLMTFPLKWDTRIFFLELTYMQAYTYIYALY